MFSHLRIARLFHTDYVQVCAGIRVKYLYDLGSGRKCVRMFDCHYFVHDYNIGIMDIQCLPLQVSV